jgi:ligand-binding sensor domain-containing protein/signal transduction histidine kinase
LLINRLYCAAVLLNNSGMSMKRWAGLCAWLWLCGLCSDTAHASRTVVSSSSPYSVEIWGFDDGLLGSSVLALTQTRDGYLWVGTQKGLFRFDGLRFTSFGEETIPGLNSSTIRHLFEDSRSNLWIGAENGSVAEIKKNGEVRNFDISRAERGSWLKSASEDTNGVVWLLSGNGQFCWSQYDRLNFMPGLCRGIIAEKNGPVWLASAQIMFSLDRSPPTSPALFFTHKVPHQQLDFLLASERGGYWRLADGRIGKWAADRQERDFGAYPWGNTLVMTACEDREGNLIVGTYGDGVYWFDAEGKYLHLASELSHNSVLSLVVDHEGNLWIGTNGGGLNRVKRKRFGLLPSSAGLTVQSVCPDDQGGLWVGYNGDKIEYIKDGAAKQFSLVEDPWISQNVYVKSVFVDRQQHVWAGIWLGGDPQALAYRLFELRDNKFQPATGAGLISSNDVSVVYQDRRGLLWVGTQGGLARWDGQEWKKFTLQDQLPSDDVRAIVDDPEGNLWVGTGRGLARFRDGEFTSFHKSDGLPSDDLSALCVDGEGVLWIGTHGSGLGRYAQGRWKQYTTREGLPGNSVGYITDDGLGNLWLGSIGLMRVTKKSLNAVADGAAASVVCRAYVEADGLPTRECTQDSQPAAGRTADGRLWFPTAKGLVSVNPAALKPNPYQPPIMIESVRVEGAEQKTNRLRAEPLESVVIPPGKQHLEIFYTSLNLGAAEQSRFRYRLVGHEDFTNEVGNARVARYPKLPPDDYRFEVTACNEDGEWNPTPVTLAIIVQPPFWREWWFVTAMIALVIGLIVAVVYFLSTQKLQRELGILKQQEALEAERGRIARDLHDQLGANLTQVALLAEMAETDKHLPDEVEDCAQQITQTARETTKALDEIVWAINPSNDTLEGLVSYACKYAQEYLALAGLRYRLNVPPQLPAAAIPPEVRHNVFLAFKEAVNNVVKHAGASEVCIRLRLDPAQFVLEIEDNGAGVKGLENKSGRNGLRNMRKRMEDIGGGFSIGPATEQGTVVRLTVPLVVR